MPLLEGDRFPSSRSATRVTAKERNEARNGLIPFEGRKRRPPFFSPHGKFLSTNGGKLEGTKSKVETWP